MVLIISKTYSKNTIFDDMMIINENVKLTDDYHIIYNNQIIEFDYLLCDDLSLLNGFENTHVLLDDEPFTNCFGQTSTENIYIGDLEVSIDHLINGE